MSQNKSIRMKYGKKKTKIHGPQNGFRLLNNLKQCFQNHAGHINKKIATLTKPSCVSRPTPLSFTFPPHAAYEKGLLNHITPGIPHFINIKININNKSIFHFSFYNLIIRLRICTGLLRTSYDLTKKKGYA